LRFQPFDRLTMKTIRAPFVAFLISAISVSAQHAGLGIYCPGVYAGTIRAVSTDRQILASSSVVIQQIREVLGGRFLEFSGSTTDASSRKFKGYLSFDAELERYTYWSFDDTGQALSFTQQYDPASRTLKGEGSREGVAFRTRTFFNDDHRTVVTTYDWLDDSGAVVRKDEGRFKLVKRQAAPVSGSTSLWDIQELVRLAKHCYEQGEIDIARAVLQYVLEHDPEHRGARYYLGLIRELELVPRSIPHIIYPTNPPQVIR
jgi:hypothetical protein